MCVLGYVVAAVVNLIFVTLQDDAGELSGSEGLGGASEGSGGFLGRLGCV